MSWRKLLAIVAVLGAASLTWGQVTITQGSLAPVGTNWLSYMTMEEAQFNVGSAGANQTWTFGTYALDEGTSGAIVNASETPYFGDFPTANWVLTGDDGGSYMYCRSTSNALYWLGTAASGEVTVFDAQAYLLPLPCTMGSTWTTVVHTEMELFPGFVVTNTDSMLQSADGWGTVHTQFGSHSVLRVFEHVYSRSELTGMPPVETEYLSYVWLNAQGLDVVSVTSNDGETNPNFTEGFVEMADLTVAADPPRGPVVRSFSVGQNYPNPFNPSTTLPVELERTARVTVKVYDETGRLVSSDEYELPAGQHQLHLNGSDWAAGTYFADVSAGAERHTMKMQLVK